MFLCFLFTYILICKIQSLKLKTLLSHISHFARHICRFCRTFTWNQASWVHRRMSQDVMRSTPAEQHIRVLIIRLPCVYRMFLKCYRVFITLLCVLKSDIYHSIISFFFPPVTVLLTSGSAYLPRYRLHGWPPQQASDTKRKKTGKSGDNPMLLISAKQTLSSVACLYFSFPPSCTHKKV